MRAWRPASNDRRFRLQQPGIRIHQWNLLPKSQQARCCLDPLSLARLLGHVEVAACAGPPMWALVEEAGGAIAVPQVIDFPRLVGWASASNHVLIGEELHCPKVSGTWQACGRNAKYFDEHTVSEYEQGVL